ncbi:MAG: arginine--tRNA ligase [Candidatus Margulisiibacteriota bacterium]|nr:MAG: hypothetical protein A2X43_03195 [Candidatus Margulisbacteria bacterium GWD2_39_127]OGI05018.1 MAG: hypothetical protein A2X42_05460 [Candidatus Margulisbacteria bacterium GWF2_38_17]OGI09014.1 MAG: hypothetical protein A2X41_01655 [Candidatus Margulisbacteria bacterium GWE2_39_32]PZM79618.1 MAG: arginine--tRNA ligase [Candidatus Margulisiibacteriota bacterium]HAR63199.1 arginine--tRNA ligase [Candidatus Margulisiibacteriota bacterium]
MIEHQIRNVLGASLEKLNISTPLDQIVIETPRNEEHGDYATNVAFSLTKALKKSPALIAQEISTTINDSAHSSILAKPINGFINFFLSDEYLHKEVTSINDNYGKSDKGKGERYLIEYVSANPTGPLHIGHGRWAAIGDSLVKMLKEVGFDARSEFYINDAGNQINKFRESVLAAKKGQPIPEDGYHGSYVLDLAHVDRDPVLAMLEDQEKTLELFRCSFDNWINESSLHQRNLVSQLIEVLKQKNVTYEKDGALWFRSTDYDDDKDRVLIRENGEPTYFAADIAYHYDKFQRDTDHAVNIWGADHHGYVQRMKAALQVILDEKIRSQNKTIDDYFTVIIGQLVKLFRSGEEVRMSKRTGDMITLREVIDEIGVDAARYFLAMRSNDQVLDFDLNLAKEQSSNNPVYYVQYAHARICSIIRKVENYSADTALNRLLEAEERKLLVKLIRFPGLLQKAARDYSPYMLTQYMEELATTFHAFYQRCKVIGDDAAIMDQRLTYIEKASVIIKKGLNLIGVDAPQSM